MKFFFISAFLSSIPITIGIMCVGDIKDSIPMMFWTICCGLGAIIFI